MSERATPEDLANVIRLLERLRSGELNLIPSLSKPEDRKEDASTAMLRRVGDVLNEAFRRSQEPLGDGGPAFPVDFDHQTFAPKTVDEAKRLMAGMSPRDYFAAQSIAGTRPGSMLTDADVVEIAEGAYRMADAMLKARQA